MSQVFNKGAVEELTFPLTALPAVGNRIASPRIGNSHGLARPTFPGEEGFEEELEEVVKVRADVEQGVHPGWFYEKYGIEAEPTPVIKEQVEFHAKLFGINHPEAMARMVHMDAPTDLGKVVAGHLLSLGYKVKSQVGYVDFLESVPAVLAVLGDNVNRALEASFEAKYYFGRPRPEEVLNLPGCIITQYPEGCPPHPAYPAGHGAAAGATMATLLELFELDQEGRSLVIQSCSQFCMARTQAGVHYADDNIAGALLGIVVSK